MKTTKFESEFFSIADNYRFNIDENNGEVDYSDFDYTLYSNIEGFKAEIIENLTRLTNDDRMFYLKRLWHRLKNIPEHIMAFDEKKEEYLPIGFRVEVNGIKHIIPHDQLLLYFSMLARYKRQMLCFVSDILNANNIQFESDNSEQSGTLNKKRINPTTEELIKKAYDIIEPLNGYWNQNRILQDDHFERLKK